MSARALEDLDRVGAGEWDALVPEGSGPLRHGYLRAWEKSELRGLCSCPVVAYSAQSASPVAACPGYLYDLDLATVRTPQTMPLVSALRRVFPNLLHARTYELGSPTPLTNPFLAAEAEPPPDAVEALIATALTEGERRHADFVLVQNFTTLDGPVGEQLARFGFAGVPIPPTAVVDLPYESFDEYLASMRSQYRRRARQTLKRSDDLALEHVRDFADDADELARLWRRTYDRAREVKREILTAAFFRAASGLERTSVLLLRRPDGSIASFGLLFEDGPWLSFLQCGFEEEAGRDEGAYFRLLYEIIRFGIEGGFHEVDLGLTTLQAKLDVGAVPLPLYGWLRHRNGVLQRIIRLLAEGPMRPDEVEPRRVFKEPPPSAAELAAKRPIPG